MSFPGHYKQKYEAFSNHELYEEARKQFVNEWIGHSTAGTKLDALYDLCNERDKKIFAAALQDAGILYANLVEVYNDCGERIHAVRRIDFMTPAELARTMHGDLATIVVRGRSMHPTIKSGESIIYKPDLEFKDGQVVVVKVEGKLLVKRWYFNDDGYLLVSDNPTVAPMLVPFDCEIERVGVVMKRISDVK